MRSLRFLDKNLKRQESEVPYIKVHNYDDGTGFFLHEAAIIEYENILFASWYNCVETELEGNTPIVGRHSYDGGRTWTAPEIIAEDKSGKILFCPPVYGICDGKLYMLVNQMIFADYIHSLDLYIFNKETDKFELLWSRPIPFKINTNVISLPNGKLMIPGRIAELDNFPNTPAVMISDSGKIDAEWRVVKVADDGVLPDGESLELPETTAVCCDGIVYLFNRNDHRRVPLVYVSCDYGETWSKVMSHNIPYVSSKIYSGQLSDGRYYLIANTDEFDRSKLSLYISEKGILNFSKEIILMDCASAKNGIRACHYPAAVEMQGNLFIIATASYETDHKDARGAILFKISLN